MSRRFQIVRAARRFVRAARRFVRAEKLPQVDAGEGTIILAVKKFPIRQLPAILAAGSFFD